jgi:hypothetical protein
MSRIKKAFFRDFRFSASSPLTYISTVFAAPLTGNLSKKSNQGKALNPSLISKVIHVLAIKKSEMPSTHLPVQNKRLVGREQKIRRASS